MAKRKSQPPTSIQCLAVRQPWAWALCTGIKTIENRSWQTDFRGPLAIQASATKASLTVQIAEGANFRIEEFTLGAIIGVVDLLDVQELNESLESDLWAEDRYCWICKNPRLLSRPIPFKGALHLFDLPADVQEDIASQLAQPATPAAADISRIAEALRRDEYMVAVNRCETYDAMKDYEAVRRNATKACALQPKSGEAHYHRASAEAMLGNMQIAVTGFLQAIELKPDDWRPYYCLALAQRELGDNHAANKSWAIAEQLEPQTPPLE